VKTTIIGQDSEFKASNKFVGLIECPKEDVLEKELNITVGLTEKNITVFNIDDMDKDDKEHVKKFENNKVMDFIVSDKFYLYALCAPGKETVSLSGSVQD
jgi:hypothetical protein